MVKEYVVNPTFDTGGVGARPIGALATLALLEVMMILVHEGGNDVSDVLLVYIIQQAVTAVAAF